MPVGCVSHCGTSAPSEIRFCLRRIRQRAVPPPDQSARNTAQPAEQFRQQPGRRRRKPCERDRERQQTPDRQKQHRDSVMSLGCAGPAGGAALTGGNPQRAGFLLALRTHNDHARR